jgi:hypothetical protein
VLSDEPTGIGGVGEDGWFTGEQLSQLLGGGRVAAGVTLEDQAPLGEPAADPAAQLGGGLAGEGQTEDGVRRHQPVRNQPHHPGRHRLGLARPGPGDDHGGAERRLDDRRLLVRGRVLEAEPLAELDRTDQRR